MFRERIRLRFLRKGDVRFLSHHDLMRTFERAVRRSGLPLHFTSGFNRHLRLSFPLPLAVGWEAQEEVMEFELEQWVTLGEVRQKLEPQLPAGLEAVSMVLVRGSETAQVVEAEYRVTPLAPQMDQRLTAEAIEEFLRRGSFEVQRLRKNRLKTADIRPFVREIRPADGSLMIRLAVSPAGTTRPEEVLAGLGFDPEEISVGFRVVRTRVKLKGE